MEEKNGAVFGGEFCEGAVEGVLEEIKMTKNGEGTPRRARREPPLARVIGSKETEEEEDDDYY